MNFLQHIEKILTLSVLMVIAIQTALSADLTFDPFAVRASAYQSPALVGPDKAVSYNPAALNVQEAALTYIHRNMSDQFNGGDSVYVSLPGIGFNAEWRDENGVQSVRYGAAHSLYNAGDLFSLGSSYWWTGSDNPLYDGLFQWNLGFRMRFYPWLSWGTTFNNITRTVVNGEATDTVLTSGIALRLAPEPVSRFFEIYADCSYPFRRDGWEGIWWNFGMQLSPFYDGMRVTFNYSTQNTWEVGLALHLDYMTIGYTAGFLGAGPQGGSTETRLSSVKRGTLLPLPNFVEFSLGGRITDSPAPIGLFAAAPDGIYIGDILGKLKKLREDPSVQGLVLRIHPLACGFSQAIEIRKALKRFKNKTIIVHMGGAGNLEYFIASVADYIYMPPSSTLNLIGLKIESFYIKDLLDKIKIKPDFLTAGKYKGTVEPYQRANMSQEQYENLKTILESMNDYFIKAMASDLKNSMHLNREMVAKLLENGPFSPEEARKNNLITGIIHYTDMLEELRKQGLNGTHLKHGVFVERSEAFFAPREKEYWGMAPVIAVVHLDGNIAPGTSANTPFAKVVGSESTRKLLEALRNNPLIRGIVIRVNSGGGSVLASDIIYNEIKLFKKAKKPVVVSMSNTAASGGYFVSLGADKIFATEGTITGSIGVVFGKFDVSGLMKWAGVNREVIKTSGRSDIYTLTRSFTDEERAHMQKHMQTTYQEFTGHVKKHRRLSDTEVAAVAEGRVWTGRQAKQNKLVDEVGGLMQAILAVRSMEKIPVNSRIEVVAVAASGQRLSVFQTVMTRLAHTFTRTNDLNLPEEIKEQIRFYNLIRRYENERVLLIAPCRYRVK